MGTTIQSFNPAGKIESFGSDVVPKGWLPCDGSTVSRTTYAQLFASIGTKWGSGDGSTTFHLPDGRGRVLRGKDSGAGRDPDAASRLASNSGGATGDSVGSVQGDATAKNGLANASSSVSGSANGGSVSISGSTNSVGDHQHIESYATQSPYTIGYNMRYGIVDTGIAADMEQNNGRGTFGNYTSAAGGHSHSVSGSGSVSGASVSGTAVAQSISGDNETRPKNANVLFIIRY